MTRSETKEFMQRIKVHYQDFIIDEFKFKEWHDILQDYSYKDVSQKLEQHLMNEQYGDTIPKVHFLTRYLTKEKDKKEIKIIKAYCNYCGALIETDLNTEKELREHEDRCRSVEYINRQYEKYKGKGIDKEKYRLLGKDDFDNRYEAILKYVYEHTNDAQEKQFLEFYFKS